MANPEHLAILEQGVDIWNKWRKENVDIRPDLTGIEKPSSNLPFIDFSNANFFGANFSNSNLIYASFSNSNLSRANFSGANLNNCDFSNSSITEGDLNEIIAIKANFHNSNLSETQFFKADLSYANFNSAILFGASLVRANLFHAQLQEANLIASNLSEAQLVNTNLSSSILTEAQLNKANLTDANLFQAYLEGVNLSNTICKEAYFLQTKFVNTNLDSANFHGAILDETIFIDISLGKIKNLKSCIHRGPSSIDHRSLAQSGDLPVAFLRGCGLPDELINLIPTLQGNPIEFYSCFISYSSKDKEFVDRLHADLQNNGIRCWLDSKDLRIGDKIRHVIDRAIRVHDKLLLVLSEHSIVSDWVENEVEAALEREMNSKINVLFPIRLNNNILHPSTPWANTIRRKYHIGDFTNWKDHDSYTKAFERLLRDLKRE